MEMVTEEKVVFCSKCKTRMVKLTDIGVLAKFEREPSGRVNFSLTDDIPIIIFVCPKCHFIELYYSAASRYTDPVS